MKTLLRASALISLFLFPLQSTTAQTTFSLEEIASGLASPVDIVCSYNSLLFVVEQGGDVEIIENGQPRNAPFLSISVRGGGEQGLLGMAFDPDYENNGYFYVNYIPATGSNRTVVSRFSVSAQSEFLADPNSELEIISIAQPYSNHNAGDLNFGPDGFLYIAMGDGGAGGDPENYSQNTGSLLGKVLRIDVSNANAAQPYTIPASNPFVGPGNPLDEIWSVGWRNPWRFSFDSVSGDMWVGDVGQGAREEVSFEAVNDPGGKNYGWRCYEGNNTFNTQGCSDISNYVFPVFDYPTSGGNCSAVGGYVYRGSEYSNLYGKYIFSDFCSGRFWALTPDGQGGFSSELLLDNSMRPSAFGQGENGDLFVADLATGTIQKIVGEASLPVELLNFSANNTEQGVELSWETKSEFNNSYFQIERSSNDEDFSSIGQVNGNGTTTESHAYQFLDSNDLESNTIFYRLRQVDFDGKFTFSQTIALDPRGFRIADFEIYPNPVKNQAFIRFAGSDSHDIEITVYDLRGAVVSSARLSGQSGVYPIQGINSLSSGSYFIQLRGAGFSSLNKFVKD